MTAPNVQSIDFQLDQLETGELTPAATRILDTASQLFYWHGIHAVGVERIAREAGVTKKTIFDRFHSKDALTATYLRRRDLLWRLRIRDQIESLGLIKDPKATILAAFDALREWVTDENPRGCAFVNALAEITCANHPGYEIICRQKRWLSSFFETLAEQAGAIHPDRVSEQLTILYEGAMVANATGGFSCTVQTAKGMASDLLDRL